MPSRSRRSPGTGLVRCLVANLAAVAMIVDRVLTGCDRDQGHDLRMHSVMPYSDEVQQPRRMTAALSDRSPVRPRTAEAACASGDPCTVPTGQDHEAERSRKPRAVCANDLGASVSLRLMPPESGAYGLVGSSRMYHPMFGPGSSALG